MHQYSTLYNYFNNRIFLKILNFKFLKNEHIYSRQNYAFFCFKL